MDDISQIPLAGLSFLLLLVPHSLFKEKERNKEEESRKSVGESPGNWIEDDRRLSPSFHQAMKVDRVLANQSLFHDRGYTGHFQHSHCLVSSVGM